MAKIPLLPGVWASAATLEECGEELRQVLEDWIALGLSMHHDIPPVDGREIVVNIGA
jgi:predicted RNase H-like HicB family nuclease